MDQNTTQVTTDVKAVVTRFVYNMWNGALEPSLLSNYDYRKVFIEEPSSAEQAIAVFMNVIKLDEQQLVINAPEAENRAAQYVLSYLDPTYKVDPPFEQLETERAPYRYKSSGPMP